MTSLGANQVSSPTKRATISDVAKLAGVSIATVSRVLNDTAPVTADTEESVRSAIRLLNYRPKAAARSLAGRHTDTIGMLLPEVSGAFFMPLVRGVEQGTRAAGFDLLIHLSPENEDQPARLGMPLDEHNADGLLVFTGRLTDEEIVRLWSNLVPLVLLYRSAPAGTTVPSIMFENRQGAFDLVEHLIVAHGRRRIAYLTGPTGNEDADLREEGYRHALAKHGIPVDPQLIGQADFNNTRAQAVISDWLIQGVEFDAVFAGDDGAAAGTMLALRRAGIKVPEDVAVVGFDDISFAALLEPGLTTVRAPVEESGILAAQHLSGLIRGEQVPQSTVLPTELVFRESCGCLQ